MPLDDLIRQIEAAFADIPSPGSGAASICATANDEGVVAYFSGTTWKDHEPHALRRFSHALSFFTDAAFRYWLPAFMIAELRAPEAADVIADSLLFDLVPYNSDGSDNQVVQNRLEALSTAQLRSILEYLEEEARRYGASLSGHGFLIAPTLFKEWAHLA
jgi:hypothetical protein